jgi:two-component system, NarL family, sensor histidine kinase DesK
MPDRDRSSRQAEPCAVADDCSVDYLYVQQGGFVNETDPETSVLFLKGEPVAGLTQPFLKEGMVSSAHGPSLLKLRWKDWGHWSHWIWLIYSVFFVVAPVQQNTIRGWVLFSATYVCFLSIYFGLFFTQSAKRQFLLLASLVLLGGAYLPWNSGACGMFIYAAALVPFVTESIAVSVAGIAVPVCVLGVEGWQLHLTPWAWATCALISITVGTANIGAAQRLRSARKLDLAYEEITHLSKLAERERIARDLHDILGHTLSLVVLKSELAGKMIEADPARAKREIAEVESIARKALGEVREAIRGYRSEGLAAEIARARTALDAAGVMLECECKLPHLAPAEETVLSLIVREAVTNIVRHAQADRCRIEMNANDDGTMLVVEDNGRGGIGREGNGLRGMRERVELLGGRFRIESHQGTRLMVEIPARVLAQ